MNSFSKYTSTRHPFGVMIHSKDSEFDGTWLAAVKSTTRTPHEALFWYDREDAAKYLSDRFGHDPNVHVEMTIEELD